MHSQRFARAHSHATWEGEFRHPPVERCCLPSVHQPQLALACTTQCTFLAVLRVTWSGCQPCRSLAFQSHSASRCGGPVLMLGCLVLLQPASRPLCGHPYPVVLLITGGASSVPTEATPPGPSDPTAWRHSHWSPFSAGLPVPLRCHLWEVVGQIIVGAHCSASIVGADFAT